MEELKVGICPFCGKELIANDINLGYIPRAEVWGFNHGCCWDENGVHRAYISVYGKTKEEVIERCKSSLMK